MCGWVERWRGMYEWERGGGEGMCGRVERRDVHRRWKYLTMLDGCELCGALCGPPPPPPRCHSSRGHTSHPSPELLTYSPMPHPQSAIQLKVIPTPKYLPTLLFNPLPHQQLMYLHQLRHPWVHWTDTPHTPHMHVTHITSTSCICICAVTTHSPFPSPSPPPPHYWQRANEGECPICHKIFPSSRLQEHVNSHFEN